MGNKTVGRARTYGDLTFATIRGAGHMVSAHSSCHAGTLTPNMFLGAIRQAEGSSRDGAQVVGKGGVLEGAC
jgi:hypothetical protein